MTGPTFVDVNYFPVDANRFDIPRPRPCIFDDNGNQRRARVRLVVRHATPLIYPQNHRCVHTISTIWSILLSSLGTDQHRLTLPNLYPGIRETGGD